MGQRKKLTAMIVPQIKLWVNQGLTTNEIAQRVGCTVGTLRVRCSQLGISLRRAKNLQGRHRELPWTTSNQGWRPPVGNEEWQLLILIPHTTVRLLHSRAATIGLSGATLAAKLLQKIAQDDLYDAVLDENS
jgi:hypothetical protein